MHPEIISPMQGQIRAALAGLEAVLASAPVVTELVQAVLEHTGDALRASLTVPGAVRQWVNALSAAEMAAAMRLTATEIAECALPHSVADEGLAFVLRRRDAAESLRTSVVRWGIARSLSPADVEGYAELVAELESFNVHLRALLERNEAELLLGERAVLLGSLPWTAALDDKATTVADTSALSWDESMLAAPPSDESVTRYVADGTLATYVEGFATHSGEFAEELVAVIDAALLAREGVGIAARRWRRNARTATAVDTMSGFAALPRQRAAAATAPGEEPAPTIVRLGWLGAVRAQAQLRGTDKDITLQVAAHENVIREVQLGTAVVQSPSMQSGHGELWTVTIARTLDPVRIRVVGAGDVLFEETIQLTEV